MRFTFRKKQRGQASIFMALFITTMILLFAFTTNIGMLVHAKINLQNAADAAAYAGAAVQARQLTSVSYLSWEMRRALKEFLFFYTIRSQYAAMPCFPASASGQPNNAGCPPTNPNLRYNFAFYDPRESKNEVGGPYLPSVCIIFDKNNNYCQKDHVPGIPEFQGGGSWGVADPIVNAVQNATNQIIAKKTEDCLGRTEINQQFLIAWLFNLGPDPIPIKINQDSADPFPITGGLERIGVLPRMAILRARVDNLEESLNMNLRNESVGTSTITESTMGQLRTMITKNKDLNYFERPIQAFLSAKNNLPSVDKDNGVFSDVELSELIPHQSSAEQSPDLKNPPILARFVDISAPATFADSRFIELPGGLRGNCKQEREYRVINKFPFGITKDPAVLTYYAVRLQAKARLLFSPFGSDGRVTISAYSAAKPFGSRIGKDLSVNPEKYMVARGLKYQGELMSNLSATFPNVLVGSEDQASATDGFTTHAHLGYIRGAMLTYNNLAYGPRLAGAYAPWEIGFYNPPANFLEPEPIGLFQDNPYFDPNNGKKFKLQAPVFPVNRPTAGLEFLRERVLRYLVGDLSGTITLEDDPKFKAYKDGQLSDAAFARLFAYMEDTDQVTFHNIPDPMLNEEPDLVNYAKLNGSKFTVAGMQQGQKKQLTSWNTHKTSSDTDSGIEPNSELGLDSGRSGYSVRFISFASLLAGGKGSNDPETQATWENPFSRLDISGDTAERLNDDMKKVKH